jgi:hypothetical protein
MYGNRSYPEPFLKDGYILHIPAKATILVLAGSARLTLTFVYDPQRTGSDFIRLVSVLTKEAGRRGILIIRPNAANHMSADSSPIAGPSRRRGPETAPPSDGPRDHPALLPGDTIMVLMKVTTSSVLLAHSVADIICKIVIVTETVVKWWQDCPNGERAGDLSQFCCGLGRGCVDVLALPGFGTAERWRFLQEIFSLALVL